MPVLFFRNSSLSTAIKCEQNFFIEYIIGERKDTSAKMLKGTIVHKALELLSERKLAEQNGKELFFDADFNREIQNVDCVPSNCIRWAYDFYNEPRFAFKQRDFNDCTDWMNNVLNLNDGMFSPLKRHIVGHELKFDIEIRKPWSKYSYVIDGKVVEGYLRLKGTIDLVTKTDDGMIEVVDYKTGSYTDFITKEEKDPNYLKNKDTQFPLYYFALTHLMPELDLCSCVMFFARDGGPVQTYFDRSDLPRIEEMIKRHFIRLKQTNVPRLSETWACSKLCFKHPKYDNYKDSGMNACDFYKQQIHQIGMQATTDKYCKTELLNWYGSSGGNREDGPGKKEE